MNITHSEKHQLTQESFNRLLNWLDSDRERAGLRYEEIRQKLMKLFSYRGCANSEELADITINRVTRKLIEIGDSYVGEPLSYFLSVARLIYLEQQRKPQHLPFEPIDDKRAASSVNLDDIEPEYHCLQGCLQKLSEANRQLILGYYQEEKSAKIEHRKKLAEQLGLNLNALRIRATRIRDELENCIKDCLK